MVGDHGISTFLELSLAGSSSTQCASHTVKGHRKMLICSCESSLKHVLVNKRSCFERGGRLVECAKDVLGKLSQPLVYETPADDDL